MVEQGAAHSKVEIADIGVDDAAYLLSGHPAEFNAQIGGRIYKVGDFKVGVQQGVLNALSDSVAKIAEISADFSAVVIVAQVHVLPVVDACAVCAVQSIANSRFKEKSFFVVVQKSQSFCKICAQWVGQGLIVSGEVAG